MEVCIKIENIPGQAPKMYGRHFDEKDMLVSKVRMSLKSTVTTGLEDGLTKLVVDFLAALAVTETGIYASTIALVWLLYCCSSCHKTFHYMIPAH